MKKLLVLLLLISVNATAQEFNEGTSVISLGLGLGGHFGGYRTSSQSPGISFQYEKGIWPVGGPGVISLGGYAGFKSYSYRYNGVYNYKERWSYIILGIKSAYHYNGLDADNLDLYGGLMISYNILSYTYSDNDPYLNYTGGNYGSNLGLTPFIGARYYFSDNIAGFAELGYGVAVLSLGVAFRFE